MPSQTTIKDIARALGISVATVSRALRNTHDVSRKTRERVLKKAEELRYKPNVYAVGLAGGKSKNIGVVLPFINHYYFSTVVTGIQETAYREGYNVILLLTNDSAERELSIINNLNPLHLDGILVAASSGTEATPAFEAVLDRIPVVFFDRVLPGMAVSYVRQDDYNGAALAVQHLLAQGYRRIAHLAGPPNLEFTSQRLCGYRDTLLQAGLPVKDGWIVHSGFSQQDGFRDMERMLALTDLPDAIFAVNDRKAIGAMLALRKYGLSIGPDIGVIGFTGDPAGEIISPALTTVAEPAYAVGQQACELLIQHITRNTFQPREIVLPGKLQIRGSTLRRIQ